MNVRLLPALSFSCGLLTLTYIGLIITTIFFATYETQAVNSVNNAESAIANLETQYYSTMTQITQMNPATVGFVQPAHVQYVAEAQDASQGLSFAGN